MTNSTTEALLLTERNAIDAIDAELLNLMNQRANHAKKIGTIKGTAAVYRPEREASVLRRIQDLNAGPLPNESITRLFRELMSECLALEKPLQIAYLGPEGTFSQQAVFKHFGHGAQAVSCASIDEAFRKTEAHHTDYTLVPVENSTEGAVGRTLDLLIDTPLKIVGETVLRIHHHFLRLEGQTEPLRRVYAHAQALAQCHEWLNKNLPDTVERVPVASNAEAARLAALDGLSAAIAGETAAALYGLLKCAENIEDEPNNTTRFLVLGHQEVGSTGNDKTSLIVAAPHQAGAMHALLAPLAEQGVSMSKLESRPAKTGLWEYVFFIDLVGHPSEANVAAALNKIRAGAPLLKMIGAYPCAIL